MSNKKFKELIDKARQSSIIEEYIFEQVKNIPPLPEGWEYVPEFDRRYNFEKKAWEYVATMTPRQSAIVNGAIGAVCDDGRFEIIEKAKKDIIAKTNIESSPDEMKVLNSFLFRCWQMGWLGKYDNYSREKPEWSEKDEAMMNNILRVLSCFVGSAECESNPSISTSYPLYMREMDWLKSLKDRFKEDGK